MFTSEEFERELASFVRVNSAPQHPESSVPIHVAALRIAFRVMRPGIIQKASEDYFAQCESFDYADEAEAICKALTE